MPVHTPVPVSLVTRRAFLGAGLAAVMLPVAATNNRVAAPPLALATLIKREMHTAKMPGLAVGFARDGVVRLAQAYGFADLAQRRPVTVNTMFHIASVTKTVTATAIMLLAQKGKLSLDEPISRYLDFSVANPRFPDDAITFRHLLMHTSSISDEQYYIIDFRQRGHDAEQTIADFLIRYLTPGGSNYSKELCFSDARPGSVWHYSNVGFALLGYLASRIGGEDMREQTRKNIFTPLGMDHTSWTVKGTPELHRAVGYDFIDGALVPIEPIGFPDWSAGMLRSSISDIMKFVAASANAGKAGDIALLGSATMAQMLDMQTPKGLPTWLSGQGLGWMESTLGGQLRPNHWGGDPGAFSAVYLDPATRSAVAIFTNVTASAENKVAVKNIANHLFNQSGS
ncbi:MAG: serine hydrolase domain-containing protein [Massilia sp.]